MPRLLYTRTVFAVLVAASALHAAPRPDEKTGGPAVVGQAKSLHDLIEMVKATVKNLGGDKLYQEFEKNALPELDFNQIAGIDPKRPFGLYATVDADFSKSRAVFLVPVKGEKEFVAMLEDFQIKVNPGKDPGTYDVVVPPDFPLPVAVRIHKQYAYVSLGGFDALDPKVLLDPKDVIRDKEPAAVYLSIRPERIPVEARKFLLSSLTEQTDHLKEEIPEPALKEAFEQGRRLVGRWVRMLAEEGKEVALRLDADTKTGDVSLEVSVDGVPKSPLAEAIARRGPTKNAFASLAGDDYAYRTFMSAPLFAEEMKDVWTHLIEYGQREAAADLAGAPPEVVALAEAGFKSLKATIGSGEFDLAAAVRGPDKDGFYTAVGAVHCREAAGLEKAIKAALKHLPQEMQGLYKLDAHKIGDVSVHEIDLTTVAEDTAKKVFGKGQKGYVAFGKSSVCAAYGPDGLKLLKEALEAKPGPAPVYEATTDGKRIKELVKRLMPEGNPNGPNQHFMAGSWASSLGGMKVTVDGGDRLKIRMTYNVGMFMMFFGAYAVE
ncbi:MAG TPA: hypothetical protein VM597_38230, partial [Gemmataceae bacterium]|nr:hypothetical protein [Gemmataceae bacterium]